MLLITQRVGLRKRLAGGGRLAGFCVVVDQDHHRAVVFQQFLPRLEPANPRNLSALAPPQGGASARWRLPSRPASRDAAPWALAVSASGPAAAGGDRSDLGDHYPKGDRPGPWGIPPAPEPFAPTTCCFLREVFLIFAAPRSMWPGFTHQCASALPVICCLTEHSNLDWLKAHGPWGPLL